MPRVSRLFLAATLSVLAALLPVTAFASNTQWSVFGVEYAVGLPGSCSYQGIFGQTGSFAGYGTSPGQARAAFFTTICHTETAILHGGSFRLVSSQGIIVGQYAAGLVAPRRPSPLYPGSTHLCKQVFDVSAKLIGADPVGADPVGADPAPSFVTNIHSGNALGTLTHFGVFDANRGCHAYAATIAGTAWLDY